MSTAASNPRDLSLVLRDNLSDSYESSQVLLASAGFDGKLQLLTSGWERVLGYGREELCGRSSSWRVTPARPRPSPQSSIS
jgi:hypothetical protein